MKRSRRRDYRALYEVGRRSDVDDDDDDVDETSLFALRLFSIKFFLNK